MKYAWFALLAALSSCRVYDRSLVDVDIPQTRRPRPPHAGAASLRNCDAWCDDADLDSSVGTPACGPTGEDAGACEPRDAGGQDACDSGVCAPDASVTAGPNRCPRGSRKNQPGACGCDVDDIDSDKDGTFDCDDECPEDPAKSKTLLCGCGRPETDRDGDGTVDCRDDCPDDPGKTKPLSCGCGMSERSGTSCADACPDDPLKMSPGMCGCGAKDPVDPSAGIIYCNKQHLLHRYTFNGGMANSTLALDSFGAANGVVMGNARYTNQWMVDLLGDRGPGYNNEGFVALPAAALEGLSSATFEVWIIWQGAAAVGGTMQQRVFDFGDQVDGAGKSYLFLTADGGGGIRAAYSLNGSDTAFEVGVPTRILPGINKLRHIAVVVDDAAATLTLYVDGEGQGSVQLPGKLKDVNTVNRWLGRSNFASQPEFRGSMCEFRIYDVALDAAQLRSSFAAGQNYDFAP